MRNQEYAPKMSITPCNNLKINNSDAYAWETFVVAFESCQQKPSLVNQTLPFRSAGCIASSACGRKVWKLLHGYLQEIAQSQWGARYHMLQPIINHKHVQHFNPLVREAASVTVCIKIRRNTEAFLHGRQLSMRRGDVRVTLAIVCVCLSFRSNMLYV